MDKYPPAYYTFLIEFHGTRDYFECHEIMEEHWKDDKQKKWLALIQLAVAVYHERQHNIAGSLRLYRKVLNHLRNDSGTFTEIAIDVEKLVQMIKSRIKNILKEGSYTPMNLPLTDEHLMEQCRRHCQENGLEWCGTENTEDISLIYRHRLRNRSDVIQERLHSLKRKEKERKK
ncbi:hypothetical protein SAMN05421736_102386 [Evansella caseinilytica]|uniref:DUF309 domain-containing protein n=1 Tax=Evansella caseinilytica TaxID=1503961 RepID=A0A1H3L795_9BACI|nr:DUF309 domain-containing protein [Evansella caseinilytica]SDY60283.1 hypothetical protein SAMN05421736_102386 [Evansella caseinilytica]